MQQQENVMSNKTVYVLSQRTEEITAASIAPKDVNWLWYPRIAAGTITLVGARGGTGKGMFLVDIAARITRGSLWPTLNRSYAPRGNVVWCETEDLIAETVVPRLIAAKAKLDRVIIKTSAKDLFAIDDLRDYVIKRNVRLIVLSPLNSFLDIEDGNNGKLVRQGLERLQSCIEGTECAIVGICHLNKKTDLDAIERLLGSVEYVNFVRNVLLLNAEKGTDDVRVVHAKQNISKKGNDLIFTKVNTTPEDRRSAYWAVDDWRRAEENIDQDDMYAKKSEDDGKDAKSAGVWLSDYLVGKGWLDLDEIVSAGERCSHSKAAIQRAQQRSAGKIKSKRTGFGPDQKTLWCLS